MATPNVGILTTAGKALIAKVNSGQAKISFSKVVFSSMDNSQLSDTQVKELTAITPQEVVVSSPETTLDTNSGETRIRATGTNEKLADGVYVKTYGVFAKDDTGNEILYGVTVSPNPNYFPAYDGVTPQAVTYSYKTVIQETSNITMTSSNDVYVSQEDLKEAIAAIPQPDLSNYATQQQLATKADDSKVVHKSGDDAITYGTSQNYSFNLRKQLTDNDDMWNLSDKGLYEANAVKPQHNPWGGGTIWGDMFHLNQSNMFIDNMGVISTYTGNTKKWRYAADDSTVVHNSGTEEIAGTKTFDTAPIDKTTGNPYITKDGVPAVPDTLADTTKPTNFTSGLQSGGVDVATAADLKSIEDSAWRQLDNKYISGSSSATFRGNSIFMYKVDKEAKRIYFFFVLYLINGATTISIDLSSIAKGISNPLLTGFVNYVTGDAKMSIGSNKISLSGSFVSYSEYAYYTQGNTGIASPCFLTYDELV